MSVWDSAAIVRFPTSRMCDRRGEKTNELTRWSYSTLASRRFGIATFQTRRQVKKRSTGRLRKTLTNITGCFNLLGTKPRMQILVLRPYNHISMCVILHKRDNPHSIASLNVENNSTPGAPTTSTVLKAFQTGELISNPQNTSVTNLAWRNLYAQTLPRKTY
jgi:hypothetical protein